MKKLDFRDWIALIIVILGISFIVVLTFFLLCEIKKSPTSITFDNFDKYINVIIPLIATWVGTVITFYFTKEHFEAAQEQIKANIDNSQKNVKELISKINPMEKLKGISVIDKMIKYDSIIKYEMGEKELVEDIKIKDLREKIKDMFAGRIPIFRFDKSIVYILHQSLIDSFLVIASDVLFSTTSLSNNIATLTMKDMLNIPEYKAILENSIATVKDTATLADAKSAYDNQPNCKDVFITTNGGRNEHVLGWITDNIILENAKV